MMTMEAIQLRSNHKFLTSSSAVAEICKPLAALKIHHFCYLKKFADHSEIYLSNQAKWISDYYHLGLFQSSEYAKARKDYKTTFSVWPIISDISAPIIQHGREYFNGDIGLTYCSILPDFKEFFFFAFEQQYRHVFEFCLNNLNLLEQFAHYFRDEASHLIQSCEKSGLILPMNELSSNHESYIFDQKKFLQQLGIPNIEIPKNSRFFPFERLTPREKTCLKLLATEKTARNIAKHLNISVRTVESHLDNIKQKWNCADKTDLILKIADFENLPVRDNEPKSEEKCSMM